MKAKSLRSIALVATVTIGLAGCASRSPSSPTVIVDRPALTQTPSAISRIDSSPSAGWLTKAQAWLSKLEALSSDETPKSQP